MNRRGFLTQSGLALGALLVGDAALEAMDRLAHRKVWALGGVPLDDSARLQAIFDAARANSVVNIPAGHYRLTRGLVVRVPGLHMNFNGAHIDGSALPPGDVALHVQSSRNVLHNGVFTGSRPPTSPPGFYVRFGT